MKKEEFKAYIESLPYLSDEKRDSYLSQVDSIDENKIDDVYLALHEKTLLYYANVSNALDESKEKVEKEVKEVLEEDDANARKSKISDIRKTLDKI